MVTHGMIILAAVNAFLLSLEFISPFKPFFVGNKRRWLTHAIVNVGLTCFQFGVVSILWNYILTPILPQDEVLAAGILMSMRHKGYHLRLPLSFAILDFLIWIWHLLLHVVPFCWRFHRLHHADAEMDITTSFRIHVIEKVISLFFMKFLAGVLLGVSADEMMVYALVSQIFVLIHHSNWAYPEPLDRSLRKVFTTPLTHKIHHSVNSKEYNSNYAAVLSIWDRIFGTNVELDYSYVREMPLGIQEKDGTGKRKNYVHERFSGYS